MRPEYAYTRNNSDKKTCLKQSRSAISMEMQPTCGTLLIHFAYAMSPIDVSKNNRGDEWLENMVKIWELRKM